MPMESLIIHDSPTVRSSDGGGVKVSRAVLRKMATNTLRYPTVETGEALVGFIQTQSTSLLQWIVLETIAPSNATRDWGHVELGDEWQHAVFEWWNANWQLYRKIRRASYGHALAAKWDMSLSYLGDWHKQPGMIKPSGGDMRTGKRLMRQNGLEQLLLPIVNFVSEADGPPANNTILLDYEQQALRVDFWGLRARGNQFEVLSVEVVDEADVPRLPPIAWYLADADRYDSEVLALEDANVKIMDITPWGGRAHPPLDIGWIMHPKGAPYAIIALTPATYPHRPPQWRVVPLLRPADGEDFFAACFAASKPLSDILPTWHSRQWLIDGVRVIQERLR